MDKVSVDLSLDTVGLYCPMPIVKTSKAIKQIQVGQVLEVVADDEDIKADMPNWCEATGHEFLGLTEADGEYHVYVKRRV